MPAISLLQPTVLAGVVEKLPSQESLLMLNRIPRTPWPFPSAQWEVVKGSRMVAKPNTPNSEAHIVPKMGLSSATASFVYLREKKVFEPTTIHWLKVPGTFAERNAEAAVLREVTDLNTRFDNFAEWMIWQSLTGRILLDFPDVQADVNYFFPTSHKPTVSTAWGTATVAQFRSMVTAWKRLIERDGRVPAREVFLTAPTMDKVFNIYTRDTTSMSYLTDRQKDTYFSTGTLPDMLGLNWTPVEHTYDTDSGVQTLFLPDDALVMGNFTDNRPMELYEGPSADDDAPSNFVGKFSKTWKDKDPSQRQILLEWHCLPVITRPEQFVYVADVD
jgi:hypothetical protein